MGYSDSIIQPLFYFICYWSSVLLLCLAVINTGHLIISIINDVRNKAFSLKRTIDYLLTPVSLFCVSFITMQLSRQYDRYVPTLEDLRNYLIFIAIILVTVAPFYFIGHLIEIHFKKKRKEQEELASKVDYLIHKLENFEKK